MGRYSAAAKWGAISGLFWGSMIGVVLFTFIFTSERNPQLSEFGPAFQVTVIAFGGLLVGVVFAGIGIVLGVLFSAIMGHLPTKYTWQKATIFYSFLWLIFQLVMRNTSNWLLAVVSLAFCLAWGSSFGFLYGRSMHRPIRVPDISKYPTPTVIGVVLLLSFIFSGVGGLISRALRIPAFPGLDPAIWLSEWLLIAAPILFLKIQKVNLRNALSLGRFRTQHAVLGLAAAIVLYPITIDVAYLTELLLGPYPHSWQSVELQWFPHTWAEMILWLGGVALSAGFAEEILSRGFMQNGLQRNWRPIAAVTVSGIVFGLLHVNPWRVPYAILFGLVAGYLFYQTNSLYTTITFHISTNSIAELLVFVKPPFPGGSVDSSAWIVVTTISGISTAIILLASRSHFVGRNSTARLTRPSRYCAFCGTRALSTARFCVECGTPIPA